MDLIFASTGGSSHGPEVYLAPCSVYICVCVYLQFSLFLLQHFPEYLSGMFLNFWVLKKTNKNTYLESF